MNINIFYPDGSSTTRPATDEEIAQASQDAQQVIDDAWKILRTERNARLAGCDWTQVADALVDKYSWAEYRQHLRDLPANTTDPLNVVWPTPPA